MSVKYINIIFFILITTIVAFGSNTDSTKMILDTTLSIQNAEKELKTAQKFFDETNPNSALRFAYLALDKSQRLKDKDLTIKSYKLIGDIYYFKSNYQKAIENYQHVESILKKNKDKSSFYKETLLSIGNSYTEWGFYQMAKRYYEEAIKLSKHNKDNNIVIIYENIAQLYDKWGNNVLALEYYQKVFEIYNKQDDKFGLAYISEKIGDTYNQSLYYAKALEYYLDSYNKKKEIQDVEGAADLLNKIGQLYHHWENKKNAIKYHKQAYNVFLLLENELKMAKTSEYMGQVYTSTKQIDSAIFYLYKAKDIFVKQNKPKELATLYVVIGNLYNNIQDTANARINYNKSINYAKKLNDTKLQMHAYEALANYFFTYNNHEKALRYYSKYIQIKDSVLNRKSYEIINTLKNKLELEKRERRIQLLEKNAEIQAAEEKRNQAINRFLMGIITFSGFIVLLIFYLYKIKKTANKQLNNINKLLEKQKEALGKAYLKISKQNKNVTDSIHYAQRIQVALLPYKERLSKIFPNHFIIYKPKDIVSGDFYWVERLNGKIGIAAIDCTGHGVPGAFMSVLGFALLNHIIRTTYYSKQKPSEILTYLHKELIKILDREQTGNNKDGMDIALCFINPGERVIEFSGANRPIIKQTGKHTELIQGSLGSVGGLDLKSKNFITKTIPYNTNDKLFMFSDGITDQFGGQKNKKFLTKRFINLLKINSTLPINKQGNAISKNFEEWIGNNEQIDDVLVLGIEL